VHKVFTDPKIGFAGGRVELFDPNDYPMTIATSPEMKLFPPFSVIPGGEMLGANMMFRRSVINEVGGFDVDFGPGTPLVADDTDILIRASFSGWWGIYTPDTMVAHHHGRKANDAIALARKYCNGSGALNLKFVLMRKTRLQFLKAFYWYFLGILRRKYPIKTLFWEIEGAARYCAKRARRYLLPAT
jgi:GT2 family glycosyltransferase